MFRKKSVRYARSEGPVGFSSMPGMRGVMPLLVLCAVLVLTVGCNSAQTEDDTAAKAGSSHAYEEGDWCAGHDVPEAKCTICHPQLIAGFKAAGDWCEEHGLPESACPKCPQSAETTTEVVSHPYEEGDWCAGHEVPEAKCTICHPELTAGFKAAGDWCEAHQLPESACPPCNGGPADPPVVVSHPYEEGDWCAGHEVPEAKCTICHPELTAGFKASGDWCEAHQLPESACPQCNGGPVAVQEVVSHPYEEGDWCEGHLVPEAKCTLCHPELIGGFKLAADWCEGHQLPESVCPECNGGPVVLPEVVSHPYEEGDWCKGHQVPEAKCTICHPELTASFQAAGDWCAEHQLPESVCPQCNPVHDAAGIERQIVRLLVPEQEARVGIRTKPIRRGSHTGKIQGPARVAFDADRTADLRAVVPGLVQKVHVPLGAQVEKGQPLFELVSTRLAEVQGKLRAAQAHLKVARINLKRKQDLAQKGFVGKWEVEQAEMELEHARAEVGEAETTLKTAGASDQESDGRFTIRAPIAGTLVHRPAVLGSLATTETSLGTIVDTGQMWVLSDITEVDAQDLQSGATLTYRGDDGREVSGTLSWITPEVDPKTRMVSVRATVNNHDGGLRAHQFGRATIHKQQSAGAWLVPATAIQRVDEQEVVFVRRELGVYMPRVVRRVGSGDLVPVEGRLAPGQQVVTTGAVLLRTEMLPGSIGAGCCEVEYQGSEDR